MDSSLCGPSNAAKGLANHLNQDRSRQQDRFVQGGKPGESFRVGPGFHQSPLSHAKATQNFHEFQTGSDPLLRGPQPDNLHHAVPGRVPLGAGPAPAFRHQQPANMRGAHNDQGRQWVDSFQAMNLGSGPSGVIMAPHTQAPQQMQPGPQMQPGRQLQASTPVQHAMNIPITPFMAASPNFLMQQKMWDAHMANEAAMHGGLAQQQPEESINDEEFAKAMDEWIAANPIEETPALAPAPEVRSESPVHEKTAHNPHDDTELARVAQQLVDSVASDESEKFRNSNFLSLMRKIAAKEVVIQDSNLVDANHDSEQAEQAAASSSDKGKETATFSH